MKVCKKCKTPKEGVDFYTMKNNRDGLSGKCKKCFSAERVEYGNNNRDKINIKRRLPESREKRSAKRRDRHTNATEEKKEAKARRRAQQRVNGKQQRAVYINANRIKINAISRVNKAVKNGSIIRGLCEVCGSEKHIHGHHDDYAKPLDIRWLCSYHHKKWHADNGEGKNGRVI